MNTPPRTRASRADRVPPTPLHGARFDSPPPTSRKNKSKVMSKVKVSSSASSSTYSTATLSPPPSSPLGPDDDALPFEPTGRSRKRRASVLEDPEDKPVEIESEGWKELEKMFGKDFGRGPTAVPSGVGLPTPAKTPARKKKHISINSVAGSSRRLFGSTSFTPAPAVSEDIFGSVMKTGSKKRAGRLDLTGESEACSSINIFTDSSARIPKYDPSPENPFVSHKDGKKRKGRKSTKDKVAVDTLGEDGRREDGMVYIFRGKKMFRKFTEMDDPDEPLPKSVSNSSALMNSVEEKQDEGEKAEKQNEKEEKEVVDEEVRQGKAKAEAKPSLEFVGALADDRVKGVEPEEEEEEEEEGKDEKALGKEAFVEFEESDEEEEEFDEEEDEEINAILRKRSSIGPRLLFPSKDLGEEDDGDEKDEEDEEEDDEEGEEEEEAEDFTAVTAKIIEKKEKIGGIFSRSIISRLTPDSDDDFLSDSKKNQVTFEDNIFGDNGDIPKSTRKRPSIFDKPVKRPGKGLFEDLSEGASIGEKRSSHDAFTGNPSPPKTVKKSKGPVA